MPFNIASILDVFNILQNVFSFFTSPDIGNAITSSKILLSGQLYNVFYLMKILISLFISKDLKQTIIDSQYLFASHAFKVFNVLKTVFVLFVSPSNFFSNSIQLFNLLNQTSNYFTYFVAQSVIIIVFKMTSFLISTLNIEKCFSVGMSLCKNFLYFIKCLITQFVFLLKNIFVIIFITIKKILFGIILGIKFALFRIFQILTIISKRSTILIVASFLVSKSFIYKLTLQIKLSINVFRLIING